MSDFEKFLVNLQKIYVLDQKIEYDQYVKIDISVTNTDLQHIKNDAVSFEKYVNEILLKNKAQVAFGGYLEKRNIYQRSTIFKKNTQNRDIHIGIDLWTKANTDVLAALDGTIISIANNEGLGNYGPTIIMQHKIEQINFYTLYAHLASKSIEGLQVGTSIKQGQKIASLGNKGENGDYAPHLHFQIIKDIENFNGDYAGVCSENDLEYYKVNCPDPNLLLKII